MSTRLNSNVPPGRTDSKTIMEKVCQKYLRRPTHVLNWGRFNDVLLFLVNFHEMNFSPIFSNLTLIPKTLQWNLLENMHTKF